MQEEPELNRFINIHFCLHVSFRWTEAFFLLVVCSWQVLTIDCALTSLRCFTVSEEAQVQLGAWRALLCFFPPYILSGLLSCWRGLATHVLVTLVAITYFWIDTTEQKQSRNEEKRKQKSQLPFTLWRNFQIWFCVFFCFPLFGLIIFSNYNDCPCNYFLIVHV